MEKKLPTQTEIENAKNEYLKDVHLEVPGLADVYMSDKVKDMLWELAAENTKLNQELYLAKTKLKEIKRLLE